MGIRRRRKKLTTTLSFLDQRVKAVELRPISLLTSSQVNAALEATTGTIQETFFLGSSAPNVYVRIEDAYYYPKKLTGLANDYVEVYTQASIGTTSAGRRLEVSGIHGTSAENIDVTSDNFTVLDQDESPWSGRESYEHDPTQDQDAGVVIGYSYSIIPETVGPSTWSTRKRLQTKSQVDSFSITGTTVTVATATNHEFEVDDVIITNMNDDASTNNESQIAYGADGVFLVTGVTSNTLTYSLSTGVDSPTGDITPTADVYIYPTVRNWCNVGDTWIDTSTDPDTTYYWTGLRWAEFTATTPGVGSDSVAPAPVSNIAVVSAESGGYTDSTGAHRAKITLEWDAPTQDANGNSLNDLAGYEVWTSYIAGSEWIKSGLLSTETTFTVYDLDPAVTIYFKVFATDTSLNRSTAVDFSTTSGTFAGVLNPPSAPQLSSDLGVVTAKWDGLDNTGVNMHPSVRYIETHVSSTSPFTTSSSTRVASMAAGTDNYSSIYQYRDGSGTLQDMAYGTDYYFKFVAVDSAGNRTTGSTQAIGQISQVDGASIEAGAISTYILNGESINATSNTSVYEIQLNANFLRAVHKTSGIETFRMNSSDGSVQIGAGITNTSIDGNSITVSNLNASLITTGSLNASLITAGSMSANRISGGTIDATNVTVTNLNATNITTGTLSGARLFGQTIDGVTITGGTLNTTPSSGRNVQVTGSSVYFRYNSAYVGEATADSVGRLLLSGNSGLYLNGGASGSGHFGSGGFYVYDGGVLSASGSLTRTQLIGQGTTGASITDGGNFVRTSSSQRYKTEIQLLNVDLNDLYALEPKTFKRIEEVEEHGEDANVYPGFIAEELAGTSLDKFVFYSEDEDGNPQPEGIHYPELTAALLIAIKAQNNKLVDLEARIATLEGTT